MSPISFERAVHYFQETAQQLSKATVKLDEALRVVSDVLAESLDVELGITCPADEHPPWPVHSVGLFRFNYEDAIGRQRSDLALGVCDKDLKPSPLVQLSGQNAPRTASRNLRVWAGKNITRIIHEIAMVLDAERPSVDEAARSTAGLAATIYGGMDLKRLSELTAIAKKTGGLWLASLSWASPTGLLPSREKMLSVDQEDTFDKVNCLAFKNDGAPIEEQALFPSHDEAVMFQELIAEWNRTQNSYYVIGEEGNPALDEEDKPIIAWKANVGIEPIEPLAAASMVGLQFLS